MLIRTAGQPASIGESVKRELWAVDRSLALADGVTIAEFMQRYQYARPRLGLVVFGAFAAVGLLLRATRIDPLVVLRSQ